MASIACENRSSDCVVQIQQDVVSILNKVGLFTSDDISCTCPHMHFANGLGQEICTNANGMMADGLNPNVNI